MALFNHAVSFVTETGSYLISTAQWVLETVHCGQSFTVVPSPPSTEEVEASELEPRLVYCYPVRLAVSAPPMPSVEMHMENSVVCIRYKGEMVKVSRSYFSKLVRTGTGGPLLMVLNGSLGSSMA